MATASGSTGASGSGSGTFIPTATPTSSSSSSSSFSSSSLLSSGLLYLKGGDFTEELQEAEINTKSIQLHPVTELIPGLSSDKFVLYIPAADIREFHMRKMLELRNLHTDKLKSVSTVVSAVSQPTQQQQQQQVKSWKKKS